MLRIKNSELKLTSQGYHYDTHGRKFVRIFTSLHFVKIQIKIEKKKTMHILSRTVQFPYTITNNWVEILFYYDEIETGDYFAIEQYIDKRCEEVWFV